MHIQWRYVLYDSIELSKGPIKAANYPLFVDKEQKDVNLLIDMSESQTINWLMKNLGVRNLLLHALTSNENANYKTEVKNTFSSKPGDFDIIFWCDSWYEKIVLCEVKRIKVRIDSKDYEIYNKFQGIIYGIKQACSASKIGFFRAYFIVITQIDSKEKKSTNIFKTAKEGLHTKIYQIIIDNHLEPTVGIIFIDIVQPTYEDIDRRANIGLAVLKEAEPMKQKISITNKIKEILEKPEKQESR